MLDSGDGFGLHAFFKVAACSSFASSMLASGRE
jgi:hypothetical protein